MKIINIDKEGFAHIKKPIDAVDYNSDEFEADFVGKRKKVLLRVKSSVRLLAHNVVSNLFNPQSNK